MTLNTVLVRVGVCPDAGKARSFAKIAKLVSPAPGAQGGTFYYSIALTVHVDAIIIL